MRRKPVDYPINPDASANPALRKELRELRGYMLDAAEKKPLPERSLTSPLRDQPAVLIIDQVTGKRTVVSLCDYHGVCRVLRELFGAP